jgi:uncharacterized protein
MIKFIFLKSVGFYQNFISPSLPKSCRFWPSCSEYSKLSIEKHGAVRGLLLSLKRIFKCNPLHPGGIDLP